MKTNHIKSILYISLFSFLVACGPKDEDLPWLIVETTSTASETEIMEKELLGAMTQLINYNSPHSYQYQRSNSIDVYAGYFTVSQNNFLFGGPLPTTYTYPNPYSQGPINVSAVAIPTHNAWTNAEKLGRPEWKAIANILYVYVAHEVADFYGPMPYEDWRNLKENPPIKYERMDSIYYKMFRELTASVEILKKTKPNATELRKVEGQDGGLSQGDWQVWVKFANSLRLRLAMNIVKVAPQKAQKEAEAAISDEVGVLQNMDRDIAFTDENSTDVNHPLYFISNGWDDIRLGGSLENILKKYNSPLLAKWFVKNTYTIKDKNGQPSGFGADTDYFGIRQGVPMINKSNKQQGYGMFSTFRIPEYPRSYLKVAEVLFLRAEGALRGWNMGGSAEDFYYQGIRRVFEEEGVIDDYDTYIEQTTAKKVDFIDPYDRDNDIKGRVTVGVKWENSDSQEKKLEKIITQKYIANFPMSAEAWTTFRRTGYPRLFPVRINNWATVDTELQLRRLPYVETDKNSSDINGSFIEAINGTNTGGQRLWWDVSTETRDENNQIVPHNF